VSDQYADLRDKEVEDRERAEAVALEHAVREGLVAVP